MSSEWIVTAGHCCLEELNSTDYEFYTGDHSQHQWDSTQRVYKVLEVHRHPQYTPIKYDICLLKTESIILDETANIVCLPEQGEAIEVLLIPYYSFQIRCIILIPEH